MICVDGSAISNLKDVLKKVRDTQRVRVEQVLAVIVIGWAAS